MRIVNYLKLIEFIGQCILCNIDRFLAFDDAPLKLASILGFIVTTVCRAKITFFLKEINN